MLNLLRPLPLPVAALQAGAALPPITITSSATFSAAENQTAVATLTASGGTGSYTWTKIGGADTAKFTLTGAVLTFTAAPDFETPTDANTDNIYLVQVQADDGVSAPVTQTISVTVTDVLEATLDLDFTAMGGVLDSRITFTRASIANYFDSAGVLRIAQHNFACATEDLTQGAWVKNNGGTITANAIAAPDGATTADQLNHVTAGTVTGGGAAQTVTAAPYRNMQSVYAKAGTKNVLRMVNNFSGFRSCYFDLAAGTVGSFDALGWISTGIQNVGGGWYRCWGISNPSALMEFHVAETDGSPNCTSPGNIYLWGAQSEAVTLETSPRAYLPNLATAASLVGGPRFDYDPITLAARGLLIEEARANLVRWNRDLTNALWTKTNCTAVKDQTGIDGVASSASRITASAANGTCLQTNTSGSQGRIQTAYVKRLVGSGAVDMTMDGGTTWTAIAVTGSWSRVSIPAQTVGNPSSGFRIQTSGDSIAVDYVQTEATNVLNSFSSPIATTTGSVTRAVEQASMTGTNFSSWFNASAGTFYCEADHTRSAAFGNNPFYASDNAASNRIDTLISGSATLVQHEVVAAGSTQANLNLSGSVTPGTPFKTASAYAVNDVAACLNGGTVGTDMTVTLPTGIDRIFIGWNSGSGILNGHMKRLTYYPTRRSNADLQAMTA